MKPNCTTNSQSARSAREYQLSIGEVCSNQTLLPETQRCCDRYVTYEGAKLMLALKGCDAT